MRKVKILIKMLVFPLAFLLLVLSIQVLFISKTTDGWSPTAVITTDFYDTPENSIDVLFLGSCNIYNNVNTMVLWEDYGIAAYDFASPDQELLTSYYYLESALTRQRPQLVVLDALMLFGVGEPTEEYYREAIEFMPLTLKKLEMAKTIYADTDHTTFGIISTIFPIMRYHDRWMDLERNDFEFSRTDYTTVFRGFAPVFEAVPYTGETDYMAAETAEESFRDGAIDYLKKMQRLCQQNEIPFLLIKSPSAYHWSAQRHEMTEELAQTLELDFIDYNLVVDDIGIDWSTDTFTSGGHRLNVYGSEKFSAYLGNDLKTKYTLSDRRADEAIASIWNADLETYTAKVNVYHAVAETDLYRYLDQLTTFYDRYTLIVTYQYNEASQPADELLCQSLQSLGLHFAEDGQLPSSYFAILNKGGLFYENSLETDILWYQDCPIPDLAIQAYGNHIKLNGQNLTKTYSGVNIVVYDLVEHTLIDAVGCNEYLSPVLSRTSQYIEEFSVPTPSP